MKTTVDLPVELVRGLKLQAVTRGRKLKDLATEIIRLGMAPDARSSRGRKAVLKPSPKVSATPPSAPRRAVGPRVKLPLIVCRHAASPARELTADEVAAMLLNQEAEWSHEVARH